MCGQYQKRKRNRKKPACPVFLRLSKRVADNFPKMLKSFRRRSWSKPFRRQSFLRESFAYEDFFPTPGEALLRKAVRLSLTKVSPVCRSISFAESKSVNRSRSRVQEAAMKRTWSKWVLWAMLSGVRFTDVSAAAAERYILAPTQGTVIASSPSPNAPRCFSAGASTSLVPAGCTVIDRTTNTVTLGAPQATAPKPPSLPDMMSRAKVPNSAVAGPARKPPVVNTPSPAPRLAAERVRLSKSKRLVINYEVKDVPANGAAMVDLWYTRDRRKWQKIDLTTQPKPPCTVEVKGEGRYGFSIVVRGQPGPQPGDEPQFWTEVDLTKPGVHMTRCETGTGEQTEVLHLAWKAVDKNLGKRAVRLCYAEKPDGPWKTITADLDECGEYDWKKPVDLARHIFVRVEAIDRAGNVGFAQTVQAIRGGNAEPTASVLDVNGEDEGDKIQQTSFKVREQAR